MKNKPNKFLRKLVVQINKIARNPTIDFIFRQIFIPLSKV
jgi:hypothetical protein